MMYMKKLLRLAVVLLMMALAAFTVNKALLGHSFAEVAPTEPTEDSEITYLPDGSAVIHTDVLPGTITGYAGYVDFDITVSEDGVITDITPLPNDETPGFFRRAAVILEAWQGKTVAEALEMRVDAVSGATYTSAAIINNINCGLAYWQGTQAQRHTSVPWKIWVALAVTLTACIVPLLVRNKRYRIVQLLANVAVLGFWCGTFLDYRLMLDYLSHGFTWPVGLVAVAMLTAAFIYPVFGRPEYYCLHVCPLGSLQQLAGMTGARKIHLSARIVKGLDLFRRILWVGLMLLLWIDCLTEWMDLELFRAFRFESAPVWISAAAIVFVVLSVFISRPYCRFVCPTGSLFKFLK